MSQELGRAVLEQICAACGLLILGMAANEWRRARSAEYGRVAVAAGIILAGRIAVFLVVQTGLPANPACPEVVLEGLTLALFVWAYLHDSFSSRRWAHVSLAGGLAAVGVGLVLCFLATGGSVSYPGAAFPTTVVLLLLSGFGLWRWVGDRHRSSLWVGAALSVSLAGAAASLLLGQQVALLSHAGVLALFVIETYRSVVSDSQIVGRDAESAGEQVALDNQELAFLLESGQTIVASLELPVVLQQASEIVARAVNADWGYVLLPRQDSVDELAVVARYGWWGRRRKQDAQVHRQVVIRLGDFSLLRHAVTLRRQILANDPRDFEQFGRLHDLLGRPQSGPTLVQPICAQDRVLGAMLLGQVDKQKTFTQQDGRLCEALVAQVAIAVENARQYQEVKDLSQNLAELLRNQQEETEQCLSMLESIADGVLFATEGGELILVNEAAGWILGLPREQLAGDTALSLYSALRDSGEQDAGGQAVVSWNGNVLEGTAAPVEGKDGNLLGYVAVFRDVTGRHRLEQNMNGYLASVSQELRAHVASIQVRVEEMRGDSEGQAPGTSFPLLETIAVEAERMAGLLNCLIAMSEAEPGTLRIEPKPVDMRAVIEGAVEAVRARAERERLQIVVNLPADLSPAWGDPQALRQIMDNLLENALRFTTEGGRISIWAAEALLQDADERARPHLVISIRDTGVGIHAQEQGRIFTRFYRLESPLGVEDGGVGLGLTVVRSLVQAHGGQILVDSEPGEGSTFSLALPAAGQP